MIQPWPVPEEKLKFKQAEQQMEKLQEIIVSLRNLKSELGLASGAKPRVILKCERSSTVEFLKEYSAYISDLAKVEEPEISSNASKPEQAAASVVSDVEIYLPLEGLVNLEEERKKLMEEEEKLVSLLQQTKSRLGDQDFLNKAPASIVEKEKSKKEDLEFRLAKIKKNLEALK